MYVISARNVNDAYPIGYGLLTQYGAKSPSRYGEVLELSEPCTTVYDRPLERVLFDTARDANPFFHLFEALWILSGRQDVAFLTQFVKRMGEFSDDGKVYHAAYGHRLRHWPAGEYRNVNPDSLDQLQVAIDMLRKDPTDRRVVCSIWDPERDLEAVSKDIPCNDMFKLEARTGALNMVLFNRSNDLVWGTYGANPVQFGFILEYVAGMAGLPVGKLWQISSNYHGYTATLPKQNPHETYNNLYADAAGLVPAPLIIDPASFDEELRYWMRVFSGEDLTVITENFNNTFLSRVAWPLYQAHNAYKHRDFPEALRYAALCQGPDWSTAALRWLTRRALKEAANA